MQGRFLVRDAGRERLFEICDDITVLGSGPQAGLRVRGGAAAHCEVRRAADGFKLVDLETTEGTLVNQHSVNQCLLRDGDVITIGTTEITFRGTNPRAGSAPPSRLQKLPVDDSGEVRRFYRSEAPRRGPPLALILVSALALTAVGALFLISSERSSQETLARRSFARAEQLMREDSVSALAEAMKVLAAIPVEHFDARTLHEAQTNASRQHARLQWQETTRRAADEHRQIVARLRGGPEDLAVLDAAVEKMQVDFAGTDALRDLQARLDALLLTGTGLQRRWSAVLSESQRRTDAQDFRGALQVCAQAETDAELSRIMARRLAQQRSAVQRAWQATLRTQLEEARRRIARGDRAGAASLLSSIADSGQEPAASQARAELTRKR